MLDIGCGIGQYSKITNGRYLGIDLESKYIEYCKKKLSSPNRSFRCLNVSALLDENLKFDIVLMVDFLHHISDELYIKLLNTTADLANDFIINFEPVIEQTNFVGKWFIKHDRGDYIRTLENFHNIYKKSGLEIIESKKFVLGPYSTRAILAKPR